MITTQHRHGAATCSNITPAFQTLSSYPDEPLDTYVLNRIEYRARRLADMLGLNDDQRDDLIQDMAVDVLRCARRFDPAKSRWHTFACHVIKIHAKRFIIDEAVRREREMEPLPDMSDFLDDSPDESAEFEVPDNTHEINLRLDTAQTLSQMPPRLRKMCELLMVLSPPEAARELNLHRNSIYRLIAQARMYFQMSQSCFEEKRGGKSVTSPDIEGRGTSLNHHTEETNVNA